jgi:hypothetical protein
LPNPSPVTLTRRSRAAARALRLGSARCIWAASSSGARAEGRTPSRASSNWRAWTASCAATRAPPPESRTPSANRVPVAVVAASAVLGRAPLRSPCRRARWRDAEPPPRTPSAPPSTCRSSQFGPFERRLRSDASSAAHRLARAFEGSWPTRGRPARALGHLFRSSGEGRGNALETGSALQHGGSRSVDRRAVRHELEYPGPAELPGAARGDGLPRGRGCAARAGGRTSPRAWRGPPGAPLSFTPTPSRSRRWRRTLGGSTTCAGTLGSGRTTGTMCRSTKKHRPSTGQVGTDLLHDRQRHHVRHGVRTARRWGPRLSERSINSSLVTSPHVSSCHSRGVVGLSRTSRHRQRPTQPSGASRKRGLP